MGFYCNYFFDTLDVGVADVIIADAEFADPQGSKTFPDRQHGFVNILSESTYTPTPTHTRTPVVTATKAGFHKERLENEYHRIDELPFSSKTKFMATFHDNGDGVGVRKRRTRKGPFLL